MHDQTRNFFSKEEEEAMWRIVMDTLKKTENSTQPFLSPFSAGFWRIVKQGDATLKRHPGTYNKKFKRMWLRQEVSHLQPETIAFLTEKLGAPEYDAVPILDSDSVLPENVLSLDNPILDIVAEREPELYASFVATTTQINNIVEEVMAELTGSRIDPEPTMSIEGKVLPRKRKFYTTEEERRESTRERQRVYGIKRKLMNDFRALSGTGNSPVAQSFDVEEDEEGEESS